jgi:hypothetical protein
MEAKQAKKEKKATAEKRAYRWPTDAGVHLRQTSWVLG